MSVFVYTCMHTFMLVQTYTFIFKWCFLYVVKQVPICYMR